MVGREGAPSYRSIRNCKRVAMTTTTVAREPRKTKPFYQDMSVQVFAGMAAGALIGWAWPQSADWMRTIGDLFIRLIAMFVGLIIFCAIVHGIASACFGATAG